MLVLLTALSLPEAVPMVEALERFFSGDLMPHGY